MHSCPLYIAHVADRYGELMTYDERSRTGPECYLLPNEQKVVNDIYSKLLSILNCQEPSKDTLELLKQVMHYMLEVRYLARLVRLHITVLIHFSLLHSWTPAIRSEWHARVLTLMRVLCNNFGPGDTELRGQCHGTKQMHKKKDDTEIDKKILDLIHCSAFELAHFMLENDDRRSSTQEEERRQKHLMDMLAQTAPQLLSHSLKNMLVQFASLTVHWTGLQLLQHALFLADRNRKDIRDHGSTLQYWGELSDTSKIEDKLDTDEDIGRFLWKVVHELEKGNYAYSLPNDGKVVSEETLKTLPFFPS